MGQVDSPSELACTRHGASDADFGSRVSVGDVQPPSTICVGSWHVVVGGRISSAAGACFLAAHTLPCFLGEVAASKRGGWSGNRSQTASGCD